MYSTTPSPSPTNTLRLQPPLTPPCEPCRACARGRSRCPCMAAGKHLPHVSRPPSSPCPCTSTRVLPGTWQVAALEESNAIISVRTLDWMWAWAAVPPLRACSIWVVSPASLQAVISCDEWINPVYTRLAMGMSHSANILPWIRVRRSLRR